jgi:hypothetical protein
MTRAAPSPGSTSCAIPTSSPGCTWRGCSNEMS